MSLAFGTLISALIVWFNIDLRMFTCPVCGDPAGATARYYRAEREEVEGEAHTQFYSDEEGAWEGVVCGNGHEFRTPARRGPLDTLLNLTLDLTLEVIAQFHSGRLYCAFNLSLKFTWQCRQSLFDKRLDCIL